MSSYMCNSSCFHLNYAHIYISYAINNEKTKTQLISNKKNPYSLNE